MSDAQPLTDDQFIGLVRILRTADVGDWSRGALRRCADAVPGGYVTAGDRALRARTPPAADPAALRARVALAGRALDGAPGAVGGGPEGAFARWRDRESTLHLTASAVELHPTAELESGEYGRFEWGDGFAGLPYWWQVSERHAGERAPEYRPGGRLAADLAEFEEALAVLLGAVREQLAVFGEAVVVVVSLVKDPGLFVQFVADAEGRLHAQAVGDPGPAWYPMPGESGLHFREWLGPSARPQREAAALLVDALRRFGVRGPDELRAQYWSQKGGFLQLTGLGLTRG